MSWCEIIVNLFAILLHLKLEIRLSPLESVFYFNQTLLNLTQNASYLMVKPVFVLKILTLFGQTFSSFNRRLDTKFKLNSKFYDVTYWTRTNCNAYNVPNISRSKSSQAMDFCHMIEYNQCLETKSGISLYFIFDITFIENVAHVIFH